MNTTQFKLETIETNLKARYEEAAGYEINIFNYEYILQDPESPDDFKEQMPEAIVSNKRELAKVFLVINALLAQKQYLETQ